MARKLGIDVLLAVTLRLYFRSSVPAFWDHPVPAGAKPTRVPMQYMPRLSLQKRDRRWDGLRKRMLMAGRPWCDVMPIART